MLYEKVKALAKKRKVSIYELERRSRLANGSISKWKVSDPSLSKAKRVADQLGVSLDELARENDE